ncbi:PAS domain S-box protein [Undibacterium sp. Ji22W]|uniref:PAS domain S-box protein n=1 Tax=Undibacterium sp. Ji22W TaxID=3413038 RepID=UPI003BF19F6E
MTEMLNMNLSTNFKRKTLLAFEICMVLLLLSGIIAWNNARLSTVSLQENEQTQQLTRALEKLRSNLDKAENRQWAFFLTREPSLLQQRDAILLEIAQSRTSLQTLTKNKVALRADIENIDSIVEQRTNTLIDSEKTFSTLGFAAAGPKFNKGLELAADIRRLVLGLERQIQDDLHKQQSDELARLTQIAFVIISLLTLIALVSAWIQRSIHKRLVEEYSLHEQQLPLLKKGALQDAIFNSTNFSSIATDAQGVIQIFNVGAERMLGYTALDVLDKISPADISDAQEVILRAAKLSAEMGVNITPGFETLVYKASRGIEDIYDLTYVRKDGSRFPANVSVTALRDAERKIIGYLLIGIDNSARKQVEATQAITDQRLRDLQFYTRSLIESNIDALMTTDPNGLISDVNQQMERLTGSTREELIGSPCKNYFTEPERAETAITRVMQEGKVTNFELTVQAKDGKKTLVSYNATTFYDRERNLQGVFAAARDVTERKQSELALQITNVELNLAIATAEKANLAKSEFLSSMSHELRTPLNAILGFAQLMASEKPAPSNAQKQSIDQILQAGWYLLKLINEILDLAMIESGRVTISQEAMSLSEVLQDLQAMIEPQAQKRNISMQFPKLDQLFYVHADRMRVKQVMINLLSNAIKYNHDNGRVFIECHLSGKSKIRVNVTDTGVGLNSKQLQQLFQPFNRLGQESSSEEGTGIGLVVTKQLVELMGGEIGVESQVGVGSVFWIELNASAMPKLPNFESTLPVVYEDNKKPGLPDLGKRTLLYVEDNPANLALVEQLVARCPHLRLISAIDGHLGIQMARAYKPDVILMDINLPGISGFGALKILQSDASTKHIPVMALSANAMPRDIENGQQAGFYRYLTKPIKVDEFMDALNQALEHATNSSSNILASSSDKTH